MAVGDGYELEASLKLPLVSIVTVTYNADKFIVDCITSVKKQVYPNLEHVIIDGGSTDDTAQLIKENGVDFFLSEPDKGIYDAMNKATAYAKGEWILFLGADDILLDGFSELCYKLKNDNCIYYGDCKMGHKTIGGSYDAFRLSKFNICHQSIFYPRALFDRYQYNLTYKVRADHDLNIRLYADPALTFKHYPILVANFAADGYSSTFYDQAFFEDKDEIIKHNFNSLTYLRYNLRKLRHLIKGKKTN